MKIITTTHKTLKLCILTIINLFITVFICNAQSVGINTSNPKSSFEVNGSPGQTLTTITGRATAHSIIKGTNSPESTKIKNEESLLMIPLVVRKIKLVLENGPVPDETIVCLVDKATSGFDGDYDAYKLFGTSTTVPYIYTESGGIKYAINSVSGPTATPVAIPVTIVLKAAGTYKINITEFENLDGIPVRLKHGAIETTLANSATYTFTSAAGTFTNFQLIFGTSITTDTENINVDKIKTWYNDDLLYINCPTEIPTDKGILTIYDIRGRPVHTDNQIFITPGQTVRLPISLQKGVYITQLRVNSRNYTTKIVV